MGTFDNISDPPTEKPTRLYEVVYSSVDTEVRSYHCSSEHPTQNPVFTNPEMRLFARCFQEAFRGRGMGAFNTRPTLFIGNLGTTHHGADRKIPHVALAQEWRDEIKRDGFVSCVLHGTSESHPEYLYRSTVGCHKVNVAGDFLETLVRNLPAELFNRVTRSDVPWKKRLHIIRAHMDNMDQEQFKQLEKGLYEDNVHFYGSTS